MKNRNKYRSFFAIFFILLFSAAFLCCKKQDKAREQDISQDDFESSYGIMEHVPVLNTWSAENIQFSFDTGAHEKYLNDPLEFYDLPDGGVPSGSTAVVGSDVCLFYPINNVPEDDNLEKLPAGELIPFAEIIPLLDKFKSKNPEMEELFSFQDNYNFFYKTVWNGKQGIVFGADLYGIGASNEENRINALLYKGNGFFDTFYPFAGYEQIRDDILDELETNGLVFQEVKQNEYRLTDEKPDDMISLYTDLLKKPATPIFVTTDLAAHANHLVFDRMLQYIEEEFFFPQVVKLTNLYIKEIEQKKGQIPEDVYNTAILYFQTAQALLAMAPGRIKDEDYRNRITYNNVDAAQVLKDYPAQIVSEIEKMTAAEGMGQSSVFDFVKEDYSQYKVRGHYTKNGVLGAYFRALMWYGRINFNLGGEHDPAKQNALKLAPVALLITDITENYPEIKKIWQSLFDPITELIGMSDDISFNELIPLWNKVKGAGFNQWYNDPAKLESFVTQEYKELRPPSISGFSLQDGAFAGGSALANRLPPTGWRLFGQRYTLDSEIHSHVSPPKFRSDPARNMVRGLDIMKVFGSKTADWLLKESDYKKYNGLEGALNSIQSSLENLKNDYWFSAYYTNILYQIKTLAQFENGTGFYFTEKPGWNLKAMNSSHGVWAELRHDTILYVKQQYGEMGGGGFMEPTFRTKPLPAPVHYLEPNVPFWNTSAAAFQKMYEILGKYGYLDDVTKMVLGSMQQLFVKAAEISVLEAEDKEVSRNDLTWISRISRELAYIVLEHLGGNIVDDVDSMKMALVADVYTNAETGMVLETAVGIPYRLYVPLNDGQGGKRIAVGYGFSYYEFNQPMSNRLNNEEWKSIVYKNDSDMKKYLPSWMKGMVHPAK